MLCAVYKSIRKSQTYLFVAKRDDFSAVPEQLLTQFGPPQLVSLLNIKADSKLALADANKLIFSIKTDGYYLQLPPPPINHIQEHKKWQKQQQGQTHDIK